MEKQRKTEKDGIYAIQGNKCLVPTYSAEQIDTLIESIEIPEIPEIPEPPEIPDIYETMFQTTTHSLTVSGWKTSSVVSGYFQQTIAVAANTEIALVDLHPSERTFEEQVEAFGKIDYVEPANTNLIFYIKEAPKIAIPIRITRIYKEKK